MTLALEPHNTIFILVSLTLPESDWVASRAFQESLHCMPRMAIACRPLCSVILEGQGHRESVVWGYCIPTWMEVLDPGKMVSVSGVLERSSAQGHSWLSL